MDAAAAAQIVDRRIVEGTKSNYRGKLNTIKLFLLQHPQGELYLNEDEDVIPPLGDQVLKEFFGWLSKNTDLPKKNRRGVPVDADDENADDIADVDVFANNKVTIAHSTMQAYKSALLWLYQENNVIMDKPMENYIDSFIHGYKKTIADKKSRGVMSIVEGKAPLSFQGYCTLAHTMAVSIPARNRFPWSESIFSWPYMVSVLFAFIWISAYNSSPCSAYYGT